MKFDRPDDDYYRREIGRKLERACLFDSDIEDPSPETVKMWMEKAKELREKRRRRKRLLISSAAVFVLSVGIGATIAFEQPSAEAGNSGEVRIETGMESKDTYASVDEVPDSVKEEFLMFEQIPEGYELKEAQVKTNSSSKMLSLVYVQKGNPEMLINQIKVDDDNNFSLNLNNDSIKEQWGETEIYVNTYYDDVKMTSYSFEKDDILVTIKVADNVQKGQIKQMIE